MKKIKNFINHAEKYFIIIICLSALLGSILITIFDAPDEMYHFQRIYDETIFKKELYIPANTINLGIGFSDHRLVNDCIANLKCQKNPWKFDVGKLKLKDYFFDNYSENLKGAQLIIPYSSNNYFIQSNLFRFFRTINQNFLFNYYALRFSNSIIWLIVNFCFIKEIINTKNKYLDKLTYSVIILIYSLPTVTFISSSLSGDSIVFAASALFSFCFLKLKNNNCKKNIYFSSIAGICLSIITSKIVYIPITISLGLYILNTIKNKFSKLVFGGFYITGLINTIYWFNFSSIKVKEMFINRRGLEFTKHLKNFDEFYLFIKSLFLTHLNKFDSWLREIYGVFGNGPIARLLIPHKFYIFFYLYIFLIIIFYFYLKRKYLLQIFISINSNLNLSFFNIKFKKFIFLCLIGSFMLTYIGIFYALYIYWERDFILSDIQGRYFLPLIILLPLLLNLKLDLLDYRKFKRQNQKLFSNKLPYFFTDEGLIKQIIILACVNQIVYLVNVLGYYVLRFHI